MAPRVLLDTHIVIRGLLEPRKLSRGQQRVLDQASAFHETLGVSDMTLLEIALLLQPEKRRLNVRLEDLLSELDSRPIFQILPITSEIATEIAWLVHALRDPLDAVIVATARVHGLRLLTSDRRIIDSGLVPVIE
jgi:PIN domain nuclease of toxin-antitoxin system